MNGLVMSEPLPKVQGILPAGKGLLQRACTRCGEKDEEKKSGILRRSAIRDGPEHVPPIVHEVLREPGQLLDAGTRAFFEPRFGHDFGGVRVHTDAKAAESAQAVNALAYTAGPEIVFGRDRYRPGNVAGNRLLAHELAHVIQSKEMTGDFPAYVNPAQDHLEQEANQASSFIDRMSPGDIKFHTLNHNPFARIWRTPADDLTAAAQYPSAQERTQVQEIVNPQQQQAAASGTSVDPVTDPLGFQNAMTNRISNFINSVLPRAQARQSSGIVLGMSELTTLANIAQPEVNTYYGTYLQSAVHTPAEQAARSSFQLSAHIHEVPTTQNPRTDDTCKNWVTSRMHANGGDLLRQYHVISGDQSARDQVLFNNVRDRIFNLRTTDLRTIILYHPGYEGGGEVYIQRHVAPDYPGQAPDETRRQNRWKSLATTIHEMLHAVAHENFRSAAQGLEESGIAVEGFAQYFTLPVYNALTNRAINDNAFRTSVEGVAAPYITPPDASGYETYVTHVNDIRRILGDNDENLKVAYFLGRIEYLGLGGWNAAEAATRRYSGNTLGAAALLTDSGQGFFRIQYGRVLLGRDAPFQIHLGGTINYLMEGDRLGLGGTAAFQYSWPNVYVRAGVDVTASIPATRPASDSVRLDLIPGVEGGVRLGITRIGAGVFLVIPVTGGPISERTVRIAAGIGASIAF